MFVLFQNPSHIWLPLISNHCSESIFEKRRIFGELSERFCNTCYNFEIIQQFLEEMKVYYRYVN